MNVSELVLERSDTIPDFPKPGIVFRDLTPVFADADAFAAVIDDLAARFSGRFDAVAGVEARGFLLAAALAYAAHKPLVAVRKGGKLPGDVLSEDYALEYGSATLEIKPGQLAAGSRVLVLDDVLATGGSCSAAARLIERAGYSVAGMGLVLELEGLGARDKLAGYDVYAIVAEPA
ncbi:adenine phosphoribosyltransferase [Mycetocola manganoxydans]|uniref:Adenine phosphoribosyltransferase n=1 Tax=Mycetocola manganoxydans TaxID=699879 RepID=A0A3L6ZQ76_9MICO|nr:adenine phosphoribosyltransferase [Mycetocola manganoxydans]RLP69815.1 adenine phosphoribosyltransferase [Mycetocola manganoxydans]GHD50152.1 adenine phosphoribosyltransferase [Mycetocola manganoxydans]